MSFVGNRGTFTRGYKAMITDVEFLYHLLYLIICSLGVFVHVFFYSLLVRDHTLKRVVFLTVYIYTAYKKIKGLKCYLLI